MLSEYQLKIPDLYNIPIGDVKKLAPNFQDKEKYVLYYKNLELYLRLRLKLKKIHRVLEFCQSHQLKPYIEFNRQKKNRSRKKCRQRWKSIKQINEKCYIRKKKWKT